MTATRLGSVLAALLLSGGVIVLGSGTPVAAAPAPDCPAKSLKKEIKKADVVFRGVVDQAKKVRGKGADRTRTYTVTADRIYQASLVTDRVRVTAEVGAACPPPQLTEGKRYIFFVTEQGSRLVSTSATARASHRLTTEVEAKLGSGTPVGSNPPLDVQFTKVADAAPPGLSRLLAPGAAVLVLSLLGLLVVGRVSRQP